VSSLTRRIQRAAKRKSKGGARVALITGRGTKLGYNNPLAADRLARKAREERRAQA
jgi:hypothetical protein